MPTTMATVSNMESNRSVVRPASLVLALALAAGCASSQKRDDKVTVAAPTADAQAAGQRPEETVTPRAKRLFDDAVAAYEEQKKLRVFDWPLLASKFKAAADADERLAEAWFNLGYIYEQMRKPDEARAADRTALQKKPTLKQAAENMAVMLQNEGKNADAVAIYQDILTKYPDDGGARARMAALYRESGDHERALRYAREALMREPQNLTAYKVLMRTYLDRNNLNMAKLVALRAKKIDETDPELTYTIGLILQKEGDEQGAIAQFKEALKVRDDYLVARLRVAEIAVKHRDWASAEEQYRKIAQYDGKNPRVHLNLGVAYKGLGKIDKAMAEYDLALKAEPPLPEALFNMGVLFHRHKDAPDKAIEFYKKYL
ncbi:MAG: adventurous gliding motility TPR repeat lipoprotein GltE, partial [Myxococcales bacterium]